MDEYPPLVEHARTLAREMGFLLTRQDSAAGNGGPPASLPGAGRFLAVLAADQAQLALPPEGAPAPAECPVTAASPPGRGTGRTGR
jgi:hypothetical protein